MKAWTFALLFLALLAAAPAAAVKLDLPRYMGAWYEIAHIPNFAQKGCTDTIVHYRLNDRGGFDLANTCWKGDTYKPYFGKATPVTGPEPLFKVKFFLFFKADYWIIDLDPDYQWALVGTPKRDQLWVISRGPTLDPEIYEQMLKGARSKGFNTDKLVRTTITGRQSRGFDK